MPMTCQLLIGDIKHTRKNIVFDHVCSYGCSRGWKSLSNTVVYMIKSENIPTNDFGLRMVKTLLFIHQQVT